jgi:eukaryotic-like serine/threonine-protein kinase
MLGGRYRLIQRIARGGMAEVWEGHDEVLSRPVAVKVLHGHLAEDGVFLERFRREAVTAARLAHPGVVSTFDTGIDDGTAYIVMELVGGRTLRQLLSERGRLQPSLAVAISRQIADTLVYAHQAGLVHRDIKPANILLTDDEWGGLRVKVTDFGIAKASTGFGGDLTRTGTVLGTPKYLSPEQIRGDEPDARADLYALGVVLFEMLTGTPPFVGNTDMTTALAHLNDPPPSPSSRCRDVPAALDDLVADLLVKDPQRRVPSAAALRQRLDMLNLVGAAGATAGGRRSGRRSRDTNVVPAVDLPVGRPDRGRPIPSPTTSLAPPTAVLGNGAGASPGAPTSGRGPTTTAGGQAAPATRPDKGLPAGAPPRKSLARRVRAPGLIVLTLVAAVAVVAAVLLDGREHPLHPGTPHASAQSATTLKITSVTPFMVSGTPDDPGGMHYTFDGNPATYWHSDLYFTPAFGNLYPGLGLSIELAAPAILHRLLVDSPTVGWSAQTYVSATPVPSLRPVSAWGVPTDTRTDISGSATFDLGGRRGRWVLLWLTYLGPARQSIINEFTVG